jgi:hypothetical protein
MRHFSLEKWADFARDVAGQDDKATIQRHLDDGCKECVKELRMWRRVHQFGQQKLAYEVPESAVRSMKAMYAVEGKLGIRPRKTAIGELLFDSFRNPLPVGVRSSSTSSRQLLYGAGEFRVDVRLEPRLDSEKVSLVGQVLNSADPGKGLDAVPVVLIKGRKIVAESLTNRFGEFHLECDLESSLHLRVGVPGETEVRIPLVEPIERPSVEPQDLIDSTGVKKLLRGTKIRTRKKV